MSTTDDLRTLLDEWKAMEAAATPGPWEADGGEISQHWSLPEPWQRVVQTDVACMSYCYGGTSAGVEHTVDAAFIAASRTVIPRLIAAVEEAQDMIAAMESRGHRLHLHDHTRATGTALIDAAYALRTAIHAALIGDDHE